MMAKYDWFNTVLGRFMAVKELEESSFCKYLATGRKPLLRLQGERCLGTVLSPSPLLPLPHSGAYVYG